MNDYGFGNFIRDMRTKRGLSQFQLGRLIGVSDKAVSKWESGTAVPRISKCRKLADIFDITLDEMMMWGDNSNDRQGKGASAMQKKLWEKAHDRMEEIYGEQPPIQMISRFESEKAGLQDTDFIVFAGFMGELAGMCNREYGDIFNRGELESSFAAWLLGATKCNPLPAHYYCPKCRKVEFVPTVGCCWDLPEKKCECGENMVQDGIDVTDRSMILRMRKDSISLDVSLPGSLLDKACKLFIDYFKDCNILECITPWLRGCNNRVFALMKKHDDIAVEWNGATRECCIDSEKLMPYYWTIPRIRFMEGEFETALGILCRRRNLNPRKIDFMNTSVINCFNGNAPDYFDKANAIRREDLNNVHLCTFGELIDLFGGIHCTFKLSDYINDMEECGGISPEFDVSIFREDVYSKILSHTKAYNIPDDSLAIKIMDCTRRGIYSRKGMDAETEHVLKTIGIPYYYIEFLKHTVYLFPKSHSFAYTHTILRLMWFWMHYPDEFVQVTDYVRNDFEKRFGPIEW